MPVAKTLVLGLVASLAFCLETSSAIDKPLSQADNLKVTVIKGRDVTDVKNGSIGEKVAEFEPTVKIQNGSMRDFLGNQVCVVLIGESTTQRDNWKVMYRREFPAELLRGKTFEWTGDPFKQGFDKTLSMSGFDYDGYIVIIKNSEGTMAYAASSKPVWVKDLAKAWGLTEGKEYDRDFFKK